MTLKAKELTSKSPDHAETQVQDRGIAGSQVDLLFFLKVKYEEIVVKLKTVHTVAASDDTDL